MGGLQWTVGRNSGCVSCCVSLKTMAGHDMGTGDDGKALLIYTLHCYTLDSTCTSDHCMGGGRS